MTEYQIKLAKLYAELIGVDAYLSMDGELVYMNHESVYQPEYETPFNPFTGQLQLDARDNFEVSVSHYKQFDCGPDGIGSFDIPYVGAAIEGLTGNFFVNTTLNDCSSEAISKAVIECLLKSKGVL